MKYYTAGELSMLEYYAIKLYNKQEGIREIRIQDNDYYNSTTNPTT